MRKSTRAVVGLLAMTACGTPRRPQLAATLPDRSSLPTRCWELRSVGWTDPFLPPGLRVRFDTMRAEHGSPWRLLHLQSADTAFTNHLRIVRWAPYEGRDSILAVLGDGFTGLEIRLATRSDSLSGVASRFADAPHVRGGGAVDAASVQC